MKISIEASTDIGRIRKLNEDSFVVIPACNAAVVCDGMGGHAAGEVASATAVETIADLLAAKLPSVAEPILTRLDRPHPSDAVMLAGAIRIANRRLFNSAAATHSLRGMGTTVVAAIFSDGMMISAHVGDSRAYRISGGTIEQLTTDHSWVAELVASGQVKAEDVNSFADKNVITRALGTRPNVQVDVGLHAAKLDDIFLLCSDGLCGFVSDADILKLIERNRDDLSTGVKELIDAANEAGGLDNSTVALIRVLSGESSPGEFRPGMITLPEENEQELDAIDRFLQMRYKEARVKPVVDEDTDKTQVVSGPDNSQESDTAASGSGRWGWWLLGLVGLLTAAAIWWPGVNSTLPVDREEPPSPRVEPARVPEPQRGLVYMSAPNYVGRLDVVLDRVLQGRLDELQAGLMVRQGDHWLVMINGDGDTVFSEIVTVDSGDTLRVQIP